MPTQTRSEAARANGAKSRGPVTERGKANSSCNSIRHGLASAMSMKVLPGEQADQFQLLLADIVNEHQPRTPTESRLTESMAVAKWRQMRAWEMSDAALTQEILGQPAKNPETAAQGSAVRAFAAFRELADNGRVLVMMNRYEARYERLYERSLKNLLKLQDRADAVEIAEQSQEAHRPAPEPREPDEAAARDIEIAEQTQELPDSKQNSKEDPVEHASGALPSAAFRDPTKDASPAASGPDPWQPPPPHATLPRPEREGS